MQSAGQPSLPARTALLALAISLTLVSIPLQATANSEKTQEKTLELNELRGKIRRLQNRIRRDTSTEDQLSNKLRETELQISNVSRNLSRISREIRSHQKNLKGLENERKALQSNLREQQQLLASQVRAAFAMGRQEQIKLILNQQDPARVGRTLIYYDYLNRARSRQIKAIDTTLEKLGQVEQSILEQEHTLAVARETEVRNRKNLEKNRNQRKSVISTLKLEMQDSKKQLRRWETDEKALVKLLIQLQQTLENMPMGEGTRKNFAQQKGKLPWPTKGKLVIRYGSSRQVGNLKWQGIMIRASQGQNIKAVSHGRVAFADWLRGFGLLIILDHGDGFMSLYGHNQSLLKETGDWVDPGEPISTAGDSGGQSKTGLYFEIRKNGKPVNPMRWCRKQRGTRVGMN